MTEACKQITGYLNCEYEVFQGEKSEKELQERFAALQVEGKKSDFSPLFIIPDETLAEAFELYLEDNGKENSPAGMAEAVRETVNRASDVVLRNFLEERDAEYREMHADDDLVGSFIAAEPTDELNLTDTNGELYPEIILAKVPAKPHELAAWAPMGGFNDCPTPAEQVAVFRYWHEKYGVSPAVVSYDVWQLTLERPPFTDEEAEALAWEHYAFCYDIVMQAPAEYASIRALASNLRGSTVWGFWWD